MADSSEEIPLIPQATSDAKAAPALLPFIGALLAVSIAIAGLGFLASRFLARGQRTRTAA